MDEAPAAKLPPVRGRANGVPSAQGHANAGLANIVERDDACPGHPPSTEPIHNVGLWMVRGCMPFQSAYNYLSRSLPDFLCFNRESDAPAIGPVGAYLSTFLKSPHPLFGHPCAVVGKSTLRIRHLKRWRDKKRLIASAL